jgi:transcriptional regulator with XRE-family HTH domain
MASSPRVDAVGRKQTAIGHWTGESGDGSEWLCAYRLEWGEVVGLRVRRLRKSRGWTLQDLRGKVRKPDGGTYSGGYFSRMERGWTSPPLYAYIATAEALEVEPGALLGLEAFEQELSPEQRLVLAVIERLGLSAEEAIARIAVERER